MSEQVKCTPGPVAWQEFGKGQWMLTGKYGMRPIILDAYRNKLRLLDKDRIVMIPFNPSHPDARVIAGAYNSYTAHAKDPVRAAEADLLGQAIELIRDMSFILERPLKKAPFVNDRLCELLAQVKDAPLARGR